MFLDLDKITLEMTRGDTFTLPLAIRDGTRESSVQHKLADNEYIYVGIMKPNQSFELADIRCKIDMNSEKDSSGDHIMRLSPKHTVNMDPGKYYITIKLSSGEDVYTLIDSKLFFITGSSSYCNTHID